MVETTAQLRAKATKLHNSGNEIDAARIYAKYLARVPDDHRVWSNLGVIHRKAKRFDLALRAQKRAFASNPDSLTSRNNFANILSDFGNYEESIEHRKFILDRDPSQVIHMAMIGRCLRGLKQYAEAIKYLNSAIAEHPADSELKMQLAFTQLTSGDYRNGFETYKVRWQTNELTPRNIKLPEWKGEPLEGKTVLVLPEQGFGDAVLFARFVPKLKELGAKVLCLTEKPLLQVFEGLEGTDWIGPSATASQGIDYWVNMMDLAAYHFTTDNSIPAPVTLNIPKSSMDRAAQIVLPHKSKFKVGVVWTGSVTYKNNALRSFSHTDFLTLVDLPNVQLFSLYKGPMLKPYFEDGTDAFILDAASDEAGFGDTAATMNEMDLIITSDTATAHIAGSLGVPTWTVLHWEPFWLWRHSGDTTPWYPKMRLFRQKKPMDWAGTIASVKEALALHLEDGK